MADMNDWRLSGRLGRDPEIRYTQTGKPVANFSIAEQTYVKDAPPVWHRCVCWSKTAEFIAEYGRKGMLIVVSGSVQYGSYENKDGQTVNTVECNVRSIYGPWRTERRPQQGRERQPGEDDKPRRPAPQGEMI